MDIKTLNNINKDFDINFNEEFKTYTLNPDDELSVQNYLQNIAQRLLGDEIDLEKYPVRFGIIDNESINAFFYSNSEQDNNQEKNNKTPAIFFTKGLLESVENEDQLAYIMGHELGHFRQHTLRGRHHNTKTEEAASDINSINMLAKAGYNFVESNKIVNKIFGSINTKASFLKDILDDHPNPQSRINANEVMVTGLTKQYMKTHNIAAYNIPKTKIPDQIISIKQNNKHISFVEAYLKHENYSELTLEEKTKVLSDVLIASETIEEKKGFHPVAKIPQPRHMDILKESLNIIREIRDNTPKIIISQNDYDICMKYYSERTNEERARVDEIIKPFFDNYNFNMQEALTTFPYKIVPNEKYEEEYKNNEKLKEQFENKKKDGTLANLIFFENFFKKLNTEVGTDINHRNNIISTVLNITMTGITDITVSDKNDFWKSFIELSNNYLNAKTFEERNEKCQNKLDYLYSILVYNNSNIDELSKYFNDYQDLKVLTNYNNKHVGEKIIDLPLPNIAVDEHAPVLNGSLPESNFYYLTMRQKLDDELSFIQYGKPYGKEPLVYALIDKNRKILQTYDLEGYNNYIENATKVVKEELYTKYAEYIRGNIKIAKDFINNPDPSKTSFPQLHMIKQLTGPYHYNIINYIQDEPSQAYWTRIDKAYNEMDETELKITKEPLNNYENRFYEIRSEHSSIFAKNIYPEAQTVLNEYLTEEEREWLFSYNAKEDNIVYEAMNEYIKLNKDTPDNIKKTSLRYNMDGNINTSFNDLNNYSKYAKMKNCFYLTKKQTETLLHTFLDNINFNEEYFYDNKYNGIWHVEPNNLTIGELQNIGTFLVKNQPENANFHEYKPLYLEQNRKITGLGEFNEQTAEEYTKKAEILRENRMLELEIFLAIAKNNGEKLPLENAAPFINNSIFRDYYTPKLNEVAKNQQNWPDEIMRCSKTLVTLDSKGMISLEIGLNAFCNVAEKEKDTKNIEKAIIILEDVLNSSKLDEDQQNKFKNRLLANSPLWQQPLDDKILTYSILENNKLFPSDAVLQNQILENIYGEIGNLTNETERNEKLFHFITNDYRINDPDIRRFYQDAWVESTYKLMGSQPDDNSKEYHKKMQSFIDKLNEKKTIDVFGESKTKYTINMVDKDEIMRKLASRIVSQEELSAKIKPEPSGIDAYESGDMFEGHIAGIAFDFIKRDIRNNPENAKYTIDFLLSEGKMSDCIAYQKIFIERDEKEYYSNNPGPMPSDRQNNLKKQTSPTKLSLLHREFWGHPLEAKAVLINELLDAQVQNSDKQPWETTFDLVAERMFPRAEEGMNQIGKEFMHSYIKSRRPEQRRLYLSAMLVAANENSGTLDPEQSLAKGVRLFLENAGPAAIKLGQAMSSHSDVPKFLRDELQNLKSGVAEPARWEIYDWLRQYKEESPNEPLDFSKNTYLGKILGSASYFVTMEKDQENVIKILRTGAEVESEEEFKVFEKMLFDLNEKGIMKNGIDSFTRLNKQAKASVEVETNTEIGHSQMLTAKSIYPDYVELNNRKFKIHIADWPEYGKRWAVLEKAKGTDLDKIKDINYKKDVSKAYFSIELMNIIGGGRFDHDRHGKQLKIDVKNDIIGLFDTGAMAIKDPQPKDKELLGKILCRSIMTTLSSPDADFSTIANSFSNEIEKIYLNKETEEPYLTEVQRGLLALTDFYKDFDTKDFIECINAALNNPEMPVDKHIMKGFSEEGLSSIGIFESNQPILSHQDKETLGKLAFNIYSASKFANDGSIKDIIFKEMEKLSITGETSTPLFVLIKNKLNEKEQNNNFALSLPQEFIPSLSEIMGKKDMDVAILKGMMKEVVNSVNIQQSNPRYAAQERQEFGKVIYQTFEKVITAKKQSSNIDLTQTFKELCKENAQHSDLSRNIYTILDFADSNPANVDINAKAIVKELLLGGNLDKEIAKGISDSLIEKNPNSAARQFMAKGLKIFLSQDGEKNNVVKKSLVRLFVKKNNSIQQIQNLLDDKITDKSVSKKFVETLSKKIEQYTATLTEKNIAPSIKVSKLGQRVYD